MKTQPMSHQVEGLKRAEGKRNFAFLCEQGTGKSWMTLADAERCFEQDKIDGIAVIAPNGVQTNWTRREIPTHLSAFNIAYAWKGTPSSKKAKDEVERLYRTHWSHEDRPLRVFAINIEAVNSSNGYEALLRFVKSCRVMVIVDESTRIKTPTAKRSIKVCEIGRFGIARRILSGTPITKAPTDLYMQFHFLKEGLLGTKSFRAFNATYAVLLEADDPGMVAIMRKLAGKTRGMPQVVAKNEVTGLPMWKNLDRLADMIAPHSYRVKKSDCLDLPPKIYKSIFFDLTKPQRKIYDQLKEDYSYILDKAGALEDVSFQAIAARTKMKQVTSGFINIYGEAQLLPPEDNPRMAAFKELVETILDNDPEPSVIVWAIYEEELLQVKAYLDSIGEPAALYYGATKKGETRENIIDDFQARKIRWFVGNAAAGGIGITLTAADTAIYYTCSYDNEHRMQSEDRNHRIGTVKPVTYWDLIAEDTLDEDIQLSLAAKSAIADVVIDRKGL